MQNLPLITVLLACIIYATADDCKKYLPLNTKDRSQNVERRHPPKCDRRDISEKAWYRFSGDAGLAMPSSCVPINRCGTHAPGWMKGPQPTQADGVVTRTVCYNWNGDCCKFNNTIRVKNCGEFVIYEFDRPPFCDLRYCGNADVDECATLKPCKNGAECTNTEAGYTCKCKEGFSGINCEKDVNECSVSQPCKNGATCSNTKGGYTCHCADGFEGKNCENDVNECSVSQPCKNGATCSNTKGGYTCNCADGFEGKNCENDVNECSVSQPCKNGATCSNTKGGYTCHFADGFEGKNCENDINECEKNPCQNGGECTNTPPGSYTCKCPKDYFGKHCEQKKPSSDELRYERLGCYKDEQNDRTLPNLIKNLRNEIDWYNMTVSVIEPCARVVKENGNSIFAVQFYGECYTGPADSDYARYGESSGCWSGVGGAGVNQVYRLI